MTQKWLLSLNFFQCDQGDSQILVTHSEVVKVVVALDLHPEGHRPSRQVRILVGNNDLPAIELLLLLH